MHLSRFRVTNYKSFRDSGEVSLGPGFNVIVGANNAGKTALAEALSLRSPDKPHRSLETVRTLSASPDPISQIEVTFEIGWEEFLGVLEGITQDPLLVPIEPTPARNFDVQGWKNLFVDAVREHTAIECTFRSGSLSSAYLLGYEVCPAPNSTIEMLQVSANVSTGELELATDQTTRASANASLATLAAGILANRVFYFKAERLNIGEANAAYSQVLSPDASNLAQCLHTLQGNPARFQRLNALVGEIFSEVRQITVPLTPEGSVRILVWSIDPRSERQDLAVPLSESGTGIGQVLAILYVVLTAERSQTMIIDEPQSFLHPGAVRKLIEILIVLRARPTPVRDHHSLSHGDHRGRARYSARC